MTSKEDIVLSNAIDEVEKQLRVNFENHKWEFVYEDTLKSETNERIRQFVWCYISLWRCNNWIIFK